MMATHFVYNTYSPLFADQRDSKVPEEHRAAHQEVAIPEARQGNRAGL